MSTVTSPITMVRQMEEAIDLLENARVEAYAASLQPTAAIKAAAQNAFNGHAYGAYYIGDISVMEWTAEHTYEGVPERTWVLSQNGQNPLKWGYRLVVSAEETNRSGESSVVSEKISQTQTIYREVTVSVRKNWIRQVMDRKHDSGCMSSRTVDGVLSVKRYWK